MQWLFNDDDAPSNVFWEWNINRTAYRGSQKREIVSWKIGVWRLKGVRRNNEQGICPICSKE
jgi:hypothetical protein